MIQARGVLVSTRYRTHRPSLPTNRPGAAEREAEKRHPDSIPRSADGKSVRACPPAQARRADNNPVQKGTALVGLIYGTLPESGAQAQPKDRNSVGRVFISTGQLSCSELLIRTSLLLLCG